MRIVLQRAKQNEHNQVTYHGDLLKHKPAYKGTEGWRTLLAHAHARQLVEKIYDEEQATMVPAADAILDGQVGTMKKSSGGNKPAGLAFIFGCRKGRSLADY